MGLRNFNVKAENLGKKGKEGVKLLRGNIGWGGVRKVEELRLIVRV